MKKLFNKKHKNNINVDIKNDDLSMGFDFMNFLNKKGVSPLSIIGNKDLTNEYLEEFKKERID